MSANIKASVDGTQAIIGVGGVDQMTVSNAGVVTANSFVGAMNSSSVTATGSTTARTLANRFADVVNVKDFGAVGDGVADDTAAFNNAASSGTTVYIPKGSYLISSQITISAFWYLEYGATILGLSDINNVNNTSRLTGRVFRIENDANGTGVRIGDSDPWIESVRSFTESISEVVVTSSTGQIGLLAGTRTSDNLTPNYAGIGISAYGVNDNTTNPEPVWASYLEARRSLGAGAAYCSEMDCINTGNTVDLTPFSVISPTTGQTSNLWISNGGGDATLGGNQNSAAITILPNPANFKRGIIFRNGSIDNTTQEAICFPVGYQQAWYDSLGTKNSYTSHREISQKTNTADAIGNSWTIKKWRSNGDATLALDTVLRTNYYGCSGLSSDYLAGWNQVIQRGNFSTGNARFSYDIEVKNNDGTTSQITLNGLADKSFAPFPDNSISLGLGSFRWSVVYSATGTINTSDKNEKQQIRELFDSEKAVAIRLKSLIRAFKFNDAVEKKGDSARIHFGVIAQDVEDAFNQEGLDASKYGIFCYDEWDEIQEEKDEKGNIMQEYRAAGSRHGVRYEELLAFIISAI